LYREARRRRNVTGGEEKGRDKDWLERKIQVNGAGGRNVRGKVWFTNPAGRGETGWRD